VTLAARPFPFPFPFDCKDSLPSSPGSDDSSDEEETLLKVSEVAPSRESGVGEEEGDASSLEVGGSESAGVEAAAAG